MRQTGENQWVEMTNKQQNNQKTERRKVHDRGETDKIQRSQNR